MARDDEKNPVTDAKQSDMPEALELATSASCQIRWSTPDPALMHLRSIAFPASAAPVESKSGTASEQQLIEAIRLRIAQDAALMNQPGHGPSQSSTSSRYRGTHPGLALFQASSPAATSAPVPAASQSSVPSCEKK